MFRLSRLEYERKSGAFWYVIFRQSPKDEIAVCHPVIPIWFIQTSLAPLIALIRFLNWIG